MKKAQKMIVEWCMLEMAFICTGIFMISCMPIRGKACPGYGGYTGRGKEEYLGMTWGKIENPLQI